MWTLESAQLAINKLEALHSGYFFALTGGCIYRGESLHDADIVAVSITGRDQVDSLLQLIQSRLQWRYISKWHYTSSLTVFKFRDDIGRIIEVWVNGCQPMRYTWMDAVAKWSRATVRRCKFVYDGVND